MNSDPDGAEGKAENLVTVRTRFEPKPAVAKPLCPLPRHRRMVPGGGKNTRLRSTLVRMVSTIEPKNADRKPRTENPGVNREANFNRKAFTTKRKSPSVNSVSGKVSTFRTIPKVALTMAIITVASRAAPKP